MKTTMSNRNIAKFHKYLRGGISISDCSSALRIGVDTLEKFTPEIMSQVKRNKKHAADIAYGKAEPGSQPEGGSGGSQAELSLGSEKKPEAKPKSVKKAAEKVAEKE